MKQLLITLSFLVSIAYGQVTVTVNQTALTPMSSFGYKFKHVKFDSTLWVKKQARFDDSVSFGGKTFVINPPADDSSYLVANTKWIKENISPGISGTPTFAWNTTGNTIGGSARNHLGTLDNAGFDIITNSIRRVLIPAGGIVRSGGAAEMAMLFDTITKTWYYGDRGGSGTVTSFGKTDNYGITSSVANSTTTPVHTVGVDTSVIVSKPFLNNTRYTKAQVDSIFALAGGTSDTLSYNIVAEFNTSSPTNEFASKAALTAALIADNTDIVIDHFYQVGNRLFIQARNWAIVPLGFANGSTEIVSFSDYSGQIKEVYATAFSSSTLVSVYLIGAKTITSAFVSNASLDYVYVPAASGTGSFSGGATPTYFVCLTSFGVTGEKVLNQGIDNVLAQAQDLTANRSLNSGGFDLTIGESGRSFKTWLSGSDKFIAIGDADGTGNGTQVKADDTNQEITLAAGNGTIFSQPTNVTVDLSGGDFTATKPGIFKVIDANTNDFIFPDATTSNGMTITIVNVDGSNAVTFGGTLPVRADGGNVTDQAVETSAIYMALDANWYQITAPH